MNNRTPETVYVCGVRKKVNCTSAAGYTSKTETRPPYLVPSPTFQSSPSLSATRHPPLRRSRPQHKRRPASPIRYALQPASLASPRQAGCLPACAQGGRGSYSVSLLRLLTPSPGSARRGSPPPPRCSGSPTACCSPQPQPASEPAPEPQHTHQEKIQTHTQLCETSTGG